MNKHTPGPWAAETWTYKGETDRDIPTIRTTDDAIAQALDLWRNGADSTAERDANARLIAAAPDLLAALERVELMAEENRKSWEADGAPLDTKDHGLAVFLNNRTGEIARAAIAKARGEA